MRRASGVHASSPLRQSSASAVAQLLVAVGGVEDPAHDELRRDRAVPVVLLEPERDVEAGPPRGADRAACPGRTRSRVPASRPCCRTRKRRCLPSPTVAGVTASVAGTSSVDVGVAETERRKPRRAPPRGRASGRAPRRRRRPSRPRTGRRRRGGRPRAPRRRRRTPRSSTPRSRARRRRGVHRNARGSPSTPRARRAGRTTRSSVPEPFQPSLRARDQHDRPVEALDEPRRDDPDHALVPVLVPEHVAAATACGARASRRRQRSPRAGSDPPRPGGRGSAPRARRRAAAPRRHRR